MRHLVFFILLMPSLCLATVIHVPADQPTIAAGISAAANGDTILLAPGTYTGSGNRDIVLSTKGFYLTSEAGAAATVIDCQGTATDLHKAFHFVGGSANPRVIEEITIRGAYRILEGGAVYIENASPIFKSCVFANNIGHHAGGYFVAGSSASPSFIDCRFTKNIAGDIGGAGLVRDGSRAHFENCVFDSNQAANGTFLCWNASPTLVNCRFTGNVTGASGGAVFLQDNCSPSFTRCLFDRDTCWDMGGAIYIDERGAVGGSSQPTFTNCTFAGNYGGKGAVVYIDRHEGAGLAQPVFTNCVLVFNTESEAVDNNGGTPQFVCSDIFGNPGGDWSDDIAPQAILNGNFSADPLFCDTTAGNYHLNRQSPCAPDGNGCLTLIGALDIGCLCGDTDGDGTVTVNDAVFLSEFFFRCGPSPYSIGDVTCDGIIGLQDVVYLIAYLAGSGPAPCTDCP